MRSRDRGTRVVRRGVWIGEERMRFFFESRRGQGRCKGVAWAQRSVKETDGSTCTNDPFLREKWGGGDETRFQRKFESGFLYTFAVADE